jgi:quinol monooxygenase YgiN
MIVVAGTIKINPERKAEAIKAALAMAQATEAESGCLRYQFYESLAQPNTFFIFEEWETAVALEAHFQTPHMAVFQEKIPAFIAGEMNIKRYEVSAVAEL